MTSILSRFSTEVKNSLSDAYGSVIYGDDAGKSVTLTFIVKACDDNNIDNFGMKFIDINGRAYISHLDENSDAFTSGVQVQDSVQLALSMKDIMRQDFLDREIDHGTLINKKAALYALGCERDGMRTSYDELIELLRLKKSSNRSDRPRARSSTRKSTCVKINLSSEEIQQYMRRQNPLSPIKICVNNDQDLDETDILSDSSDSDDTEFSIQSVILVLRRTRQRQSGKQLFANVASSAILPSAFRLDDECDRAALFIRRLIPSSEETSGAWEEILMDSTDWLLPSGSIMPPLTPFSNQHVTETSLNSKKMKETIPPDQYEVLSKQKLEQIRDRMRAEALERQQNNRKNDINVDSGVKNKNMETKTIRSLIQSAYGLAFVRSSKLGILGMSVNGGTGIVIARLPDGTWSSPSAIGFSGMGFGMQFGFESMESIWILQTKESVEQFQSGTNFAIGGNVGYAVPFKSGGREVYGAATTHIKSDSSISNITGCTPTNSSLRNHSRSEENENGKKIDVSHIVAYAKTSGLYFGVSLEGNRIYTRHDINSRTYQFMSNKPEISALEILSGKLPTPPEAEDLYEALYNVEYSNDMPKLPAAFLKINNDTDWKYDSDVPSIISSASSISRREIQVFQDQFEKFLFGGIAVERLILNECDGNKSSVIHREQRTLWLSESDTGMGSLRLGYLSKLSFLENQKQRTKKSSTWQNNISPSSLNSRTTYSSNLNSSPSYSASNSLDSESTDFVHGDSYDSEYSDEEENPSSAKFFTFESHHIPQNYQQNKLALSEKHSIALTDIISITQHPPTSVLNHLQNNEEFLLIILIRDVFGNSLFFLTHSFQEAEIVMCGMKLLLEKETIRLGVRGGSRWRSNKRRSFISDDLDVTPMSPEAARGFATSSMNNPSIASSDDNRDLLSTSSSDSNTEGDSTTYLSSPDKKKRVPDGRQSWSRVPARNYLKSQASPITFSDQETEDNYLSTNGSSTLSKSPSKTSYFSDYGNSHSFSMPMQQTGCISPTFIFEHGQNVVRDIAVNVQIPLPLPLCRILLLDSKSPVLGRWQADRGDFHYQISPWIFPSTKNPEPSYESEHRFLSTQSVTDASRTVTFDRYRNGDVVKLAEHLFVESDNLKDELSLLITEQMPRRGFFIRVRIILQNSQAVTSFPNPIVQSQTCEANLVAELCPIGKNMSNQTMIHKAFALVWNEVKSRYGTHPTGLLGALLAVISHGSQKNVIPETRGSLSLSPMKKRKNLFQKVHSNPTTPIRSAASYARSISSTPTNIGHPNHPKDQASNALSFDDVLQSRTQKETKRHQQQQSKRNQKNQSRPGTPSDMDLGDVNMMHLPITYMEEKRATSSEQYSNNQFADFPPTNDSKNESSKLQSPSDGGATASNSASNLTIEVKPLPKIRLDLMPSPREQDEFEYYQRRRRHHKSHRHKNSRHGLKSSKSGDRTRIKSRR